MKGFNKDASSEAEGRASGAVKVAHGAKQTYHVIKMIVFAILFVILALVTTADAASNGARRKMKKRMDGWLR